MLATVAETIRRYRMLEGGQRVGVAVSGGADSVCLLHVLRELAAEWDLRLTVLHLNHGLRGEESCADERFVCELADRLQLPVIARAKNVAEAGGNLEQSAREARLAFFREQMEGGLDRVATGHTRDDQAETVLYRFLRGSGGAGLAAIRPVTSEGLVRPLLHVTRAEIERYLRERGISWREDSSNASLQFARNRIRHELLPQLARDWNPAIGETLARSADWALAEEEYWEAEVGRLWGGFERATIPAQVLRDLPLAVARRLVRHAIRQVKGDLRGIEFAHIQKIVDLGSFSKGHGRVQVPGVEVERSLDWVRFADSVSARKPPESYSFSAPVPGLVPIPGTGIAISLEMVEKAETGDPSNSVYNGETGFLDCRAMSGSLEIRNWKPGDRYQPEGSADEEKIKALFQQARIPRWERRQWPVLTDGDAIVWARRFGAAAPYAANPACTNVLRIRIWNR